MAKKTKLEQFLVKNSKLVNKQLMKTFPKKLTKQWLDFALGKTLLSYDIKTCNSAVSKPIWDLLSRGGKRWRPLLALLSYKAVGCYKKEILPFLSLPEFIHNGTLIIDDVEDNSLMRRNALCIHHKYGIDIAVNDGNAMYFLPLTILYKNIKKLSPKTKAAIYDLYSQELVRLSFGQAMDIYWSKTKNTKVTEKEYLQMCYFKTGTLARFSAKLGAIIAKAPQKTTDILGEFAADIGVAFQIRDDILNLEHTSEWGKKIGEDITEGKRTLLVINTLKHLSSKEKKEFIKILNSKTNSKKKILKAINYIRSTKSIDYAKKKAISIVKNSWSKLNKQLPHSNAKNTLKLFANYLIERDI